MASKLSWDDSPSTDGPQSPFEVPPTPPPKDDHYQPRAPQERRTFPVRSASIVDSALAAELAMRPPLSRYSTYLGPETGKQRARSVSRTKVAKHPALSLQTKHKIHVTTGVVTTRSSPSSLRKFSSMDQLGRTTTLISAGLPDRYDMPTEQTITASPSQITPGAPRLEDPPAKAKPAIKRNSLISRRPSLRRSLSQPIDLAAATKELKQQVGSRPSVESNKSSPPVLTTKKKRSKKAPPEVIPVLVPDDEDITALVKAPDPETDSDNSSVRTSSSCERTAGKSTRSSSLTISDANLAAMKASLASPVSEPARSRQYASEDPTPLSPISPSRSLAKSRRSSCSSVPSATHWNPPRAVPMLPASVVLRHDSEPAIPVTATKLHRRSASMQFLLRARRTGSGSSTSTAAASDSASPRNDEALKPIKATPQNSISTETTTIITAATNKLQKSRRMTKSTPMLRDAAGNASPSPTPSQSSKRSVPKVPSRFVSPPQLVHEWEISAPKASRGPRILPSLPNFLRKSSRTLTTTAGSSTGSNSAVTPFASPDQPPPALKRVSLHAHNSSIASAFANTGGVAATSSYTVTCTSDNRPDKRSGNKNTKTISMARGSANRLAAMPIDHPDIPISPPTIAPYTPGLREWDEDEFKRWEEEDNRLNALTKNGNQRSKDGFGSLVTGGLRRGLSISQRGGPIKGRYVMESESSTSSGRTSTVVPPTDFPMPISHV